MVAITRSTSVDGHAEAFDDLALAFGLGRARSACGGVTTSRRCSMKCPSVSLRFEHRGPTVDDREVDDAERRLQVGQAVKLVQDDLREDVLLQLDHEAHAVAIALVAGLA